MNSSSSSAPILLAGTIGIDTIITPSATAEGVLGGSASFAAVAARLFAEKIDVLSVIGEDFPERYWDELNASGINLHHVDRVSGPSFAWTGEYEVNMNKRRTVSALDHVMLDWKVRVPEQLRKHPVIAVTCMVPERQLEFISQCESPRLVISDSMDKWINRQPEWLDKVISRSHVAMMNEDEAKGYASCTNIMEAGEFLLSKGAKHAIIKQGEYGAILFSRTSEKHGTPSIFRCPAWPLKSLIDPTGAGDTFLGAMSGYLSTLPSLSPTFEEMKTAIILATVAASFTCESFSADSLFTMDHDKFQERLRAFLDMIRLPRELDC